MMQPAAKKAAHDGKSHLIKPTQPFERLSIDFKGPFPSSTTNCHLLTVIDEFSRFPFAFPCPDMKTSTMIRCLRQHIAILGMPAYINSDRGISFMSSELKHFLHSHGVSNSRKSTYNLGGNGQCERYNGVIWKNITPALKSRGPPTPQWENVLPDALHSVRSLFSTVTNITPQERLFNYQCQSTSGCSIPT